MNRNLTGVKEADWIEAGFRWDTPAKVNLFLEVLAKRPDGFHEIETLMTAISIYDSLLITPNSQGRIEVSCGWASGLEARRVQGVWSPLPSETKNLVYLAAERLARRAQMSQGVAIRLIKRIPLEAGLGGASSDAAAALLALNEFWRLGWSREDLSALAAELGSDVPFFLLQPGRGAMAAVCRGRGEWIAPVEGVPRLHLVIAKPQRGLSTAAVYGRCRIPTTAKRVEPLVKELQSGSLFSAGRHIFNRLQEVAEVLCGEVAELRRTCEQLGVWGHGMSGSGTSYFVWCRSAGQARQVSVRLRAQHGCQVFQASTL